MLVDKCPQWALDLSLTVLVSDLLVTFLVADHLVIILVTRRLQLLELKKPPCNQNSHIEVSGNCFGQLGSLVQSGHKQS